MFFIAQLIGPRRAAMSREIVGAEAPCADRHAMNASTRPFVIERTVSGSGSSRFARM
ncbi:hypothetical protein [Sphingomonas sp. ABOLG]|uniref:hypothetical protein n=1 Tax=Sphingomonas sp. ABOLG TaxID=1985880 RepID=UPI0013DDF690|nr:hypothetical protein [Sphingomonas sp. ABOLG]